MTAYADRVSTLNTDGTPLYATDADTASEDEVRKIIQTAWRCELFKMGKLCPIDFYAIRDGRLVGFLELKTRSHASTDYPDVFLNLRKYLALILEEAALGCPALFVVRFTDRCGWVRVSHYDWRGCIVMGGTRRFVKSHTDREPVVKVPISDFTWFSEAA